MSQDGEQLDEDARMTLDQVLAERDAANLRASDATKRADWAELERDRVMRRLGEVGKAAAIVTRERNAIRGHFTADMPGDVRNAARDARYVGRENHAVRLDAIARAIEAVLVAPFPVPPVDETPLPEPVQALVDALAAHPEVRVTFNRPDPERYPWSEATAGDVLDQIEASIAAGRAMGRGAYAIVGHIARMLAPDQHPAFRRYEPG